MDIMIDIIIKQCNKFVDDSKHIDLLITTDEEENYHYIWIKDLNKLCHNHTKHDGKKHFCKNCIQCFTTKEILEKHKPDCMTLNKYQAVKLPQRDKNGKPKTISLITYRIQYQFHL